MAGYQGRGLHGQVVEQMGVRIVGGAYPTGAPLYSEQLEREFDVSKTVVREALKVLAAKGLVESRQKRGTVIRPRDEWNLLDGDVLRWQGRDAPNFVFLENLAEVRAMVEPAAARLAAERRTEDDLVGNSSQPWPQWQQPSKTLDAMVSTEDLRFHRALLDAAPGFVELPGTIYHQCTGYSGGGLPFSYAYHPALYLRETPITGGLMAGFSK